jgi:exonuclease I
MRAPQTVAEELELGPELSEALYELDDLRKASDVADGESVPAVSYGTMSQTVKDALFAMARIVNAAQPDRLRDYVYKGKSKTYYILAESDTDALECVPKAQRTDVGMSMIAWPI